MPKVRKDNKPPISRARLQTAAHCQKENKEEKSMSEHQHNFVYQGQATWPSKYTRPGSGAHDRYYGDLYYCNECLARRITNERILGNTYEHVRFEAVEYTEKPE